jgi:DNA sulfur modification protein DndE
MKKLYIITVVFAMILFSCKKETSSPNKDTSNSMSAADSTKVALVTQAYIYGYPMMTMDYTHKISSNVTSDNGMGKGPMNQWGNMHKFPKAGFTEVVRPNLDTYYSVIYADLGESPLYLHIPATERYYLMPILNAHGDVIKSVGSRTTGQAAVDIALVGPKYDGEIDDDLTVIRSTTNLNWMLGRVAVKNNEDGKVEIANFQSKLIARPLSERNNKDYVNPKGIINPDYLNKVPMDEVDNKDITSYLNEVMQLMLENPSYATDAPLLENLKTIGFEPGGTFKLDQFSSQAQEMIKKVPTIVQGLFSKMTANPPSENLQNGWNVITSGLGEYGTGYFLRAYVTKIGYGANQSVDAIYPNSAVDSDGNSYNGSNKYVLHFDADHMPPVNGFWSLTMYDKKGFLVDNAIDRYNLGGMKDLTFNKDGSLDIFIQAQEPEKLKSNWLPSPQAGMEFELTFRMYYPKENVIDRSYTMPGVKKVQ